MIRRAFPWIVFGMPGVLVSFVLHLSALSGLVVCVAIGAISGVWAWLFDGEVPW